MNDCGANTGKVDLTHMARPVVVELMDLDELSVDEQRHRVDHGVNAVLEHRGTLACFAAVYVADLGRVQLVQELFGAHLDEDVGKAGRVAHADQGRDSGRPCVFVKCHHGPGGVEVIADVHVVHPGLDGGGQGGWTEPVEGSDTVEHHVGLAEERHQCCLVGDVHGRRPQARIAELVDHRPDRLGPGIGHDDRGAVRQCGQGLDGDATNAACTSQYDNRSHSVLPGGAADVGGQAPTCSAA